MIYWSPHPICGDLPIIRKDEITEFAIDCLINDVDTEQSTGEINGNINNKLRKIIDDHIHDLQYISEAFYQETLYENFEKDIWELYKYEIIHQYMDNENYSFIIPFYFIIFDIRVKKEYIPYLIEMLRDGNAAERDYDSWDTIDTYHPMYYVTLVKNYSSQLFDEKNHELNEHFVEKHSEIKNVYPTDIIEAVFQF